MIGSLLLDDQGDLLCGEHEDGLQTIVAAVGAEVIAQSASQAIGLHQGRVWWNLEAGVDYDGLFYNPQFSSDQMEVMRSSEIRETLLSVPGVAGFYEDAPVEFVTTGRAVKMKIPCLQIDCENSRFRGVIEPMEPEI